MNYTKEDGSPNLTKSNIMHYFKTRPSTLFDIPFFKADKKVWQVLNPIPGLKEMSLSDWNYYFLGWTAWTIDAIDFFCVSAAAPEIAATLGVDIVDITWGMTLVLMLRSVGALIFGISSDYYGRKWPFIVNLFIFVVLEIATGFVKTYKEFLAVRALFGIAMGGMYGNAAATAIENQPIAARSILSGLFLPAYNFGYALAVIFFRAFENTYKPGEGWRSLFWFSAGLPVIVIIWRMFFPESAHFLRLKSQRQLEAKSDIEQLKVKKVKKNVFNIIRTEGLMFAYLVLFAAGIHFTSHGSADLYPTFLVKQHNIGSDRKTVTMVVCNLGAVAGGLFFGQMTELLGRRLCIMACMLTSGAFIYPAFLSNDINVLTAGFFFVNFGIAGAAGVVPLHTFELFKKENRVILSGLGMYFILKVLKLDIN